MFGKGKGRGRATNVGKNKLDKLTGPRMEAGRGRATLTSLRV